MNKLTQLAWAGLAVGLIWTTTSAQAQQRVGFGGFGRGQLSLLSQKSVQEELKLSEDQVKKATELSEKSRGSFKDLQGLGREEMRKKLEEISQANDKAVAEILKPEQTKRLKQISWQQRGGQALADAEVAAALKLSNEQKEKVKAIQEEAQKSVRELFQGGNREEARRKIEEMRKANEEKYQAVLSAEQKTKLKDLTGEPFKGELTRPGRRPKQP